MPILQLIHVEHCVYECVIVALYIHNSNNNNNNSYEYTQFHRNSGTYIIRGHYYKECLLSTEQWPSIASLQLK